VSEDDILANSSTWLRGVTKLISLQVKRMQEMPDKFHLLLQEPECTNVCFWYIPER
jgi:hypothetical protein